MSKGEKAPQFLKEFSKEESPEERTQLAREIKNKRKKRSAESEILNKSRAQLEAQAGSKSEAASEQFRSIEKLNKQLEDLSESGVGKFLNYFQIRRLRADVISGQKTYEELLQEKNAAESALVDISDGLKRHEENPINDNCRLMLKKFYDGQASKWKGV